MKRIWKIAGIAVVIAVLGVAALGAATYAQDADNGQPFDFAAKFKEALASALGITVDEYDAAVDKAQNQVADEAVTEGWLTQDQADLLKWRMAEEPAFGMRGLGKGLGGFDRGFFGGGDNLVSIAADKLGMKLTDLLTELQGGKSIATVAGEKGVDTQVIVDAYVAQVKENLDEAVTAGRITQKQADYQLQQLEQRVTDQLDNTWTGDFHGGGRHGGPMGFPGFGGL
jgi:polyhydroxyalkanoate synthesis regulator phasin